MSKPSQHACSVNAPSGREKALSDTFGHNAITIRPLQLLHQLLPTILRTPDGHAWHPFSHSTIVRITLQCSSPDTSTTTITSAVPTTTTSMELGSKMSSLQPHIHLAHRPGRSLANPSHKDSGIHRTPSTPTILTTLIDNLEATPDFSCLHCAQKFTSRIGLVSQQRIHRTETVEPVLGTPTYNRHARLSLPHCSRTFKHRMGLNGHMRLQERLRPVSRQSQEDRRRERTQVAGAAGAAPGRATTPGSDPTEWECHKGHIKKEPLQPDSQSASQPLHTKHTLG
ncbi:unnamed protein product [Schistocephalus solidus]|uniref:C2H2-type domain-containing protein n=1 Tax=Schistocephalus solidus TaxID=70667 RepID=A0A183TJP2_SCHSO|nr:unnamed protein product [Schistocephalus solidus]